MKILSKIKLILTESYRWRHRELIINPTEGQLEPKPLSVLTLLKNNVILLAGCFFLTYFFQNLVNSEIAGYLINALSIFVGLFTSVLILFFDKYLSYKTNTEVTQNENESNKIERLKVKNFSNRFLFITLETILIAIVLIALLSSPLIFGGFFKEDFRDYYFEIGYDQFFVCLGLILIVSIKVLTICFFYKIALRLLFIFGSWGEYMYSVLNNKIKNL